MINIVLSILLFCLSVFFMMLLTEAPKEGGENIVLGMLLTYLFLLPLIVS